MTIALIAEWIGYVVLAIFGAMLVKLLWAFMKGLWKS